jgi:capsular exopolysaccharide synthesis family protein
MRPSDADLPEPARNRPEPRPTVPIRAAAAPPANRPPLPPALASSGPDAGALLKAFRRRWPVAVTFGLIAAALAGTAAWDLLSAKYVVFAQLRIASAAPRLVFRDADSDGRSEGMYQRTAAAMIKSRFVLNAALKSEDVKRLNVVLQQSDPIAWLEEELKVEFKDNSELVSVSMTGEDPAELMVLVNAVTGAYLREVGSEETKQRSQKLAELDDVYTKAKEKLRVKRETLRKRAEELGTSDSQALTQKQLLVLTNYSELRRQHAANQYELMKAQARLATYKGRLKDSSQVISEAAVNEAMEADPKIQGLQKRMAQLQALVTEYELTAARPTENTLVRARNQLALCKKEMADRRAELKPAIVQRMGQRSRADTEAYIVEIQDEINLLTEQDKSMLGQIQTLAKDADNIGRSFVELEMLRADIRQEEQIVDRVGHELEAGNVELRSPSRVRQYQDAAVQRKDIKRQVMGVTVAPIAAFLGVCFCVAWLDCRGRRIHTADQVVRGLGMRVVGAVPPLPSPLQTQLIAAGEAQDGHGQDVLESVDALRTLLLRDASLEHTRLVMVTSATQGEGKTTLASHLAGSLARAGRRTLLVDCDLRCPAAHQLFELPMQPGFSEVLLGEIEADDAIQETPIDGLWLCPAGQWDRDVIQALAKEGLEQSFERFKEQFDFVVVDSHPVLEATDSLLIGQHVDAVLLSLMRDVSQVPRVYAAGQRLQNLGVRVLGAVVNGLAQDDLYGHALFQVPLQAAG